MANVPVRHRQRRNVNLDIFTDELHADVGAAAFCLAELKEATGHDYFSKEDLIIRTAGGGGGVLLVEGTHYSLSEENNIYSTLATNAAGSTKTIYKKIQIINPGYQAGNLYYSGKYFTDYADPFDLNNITRKIIPRISSFTIGDFPGYQHNMITTGTAAYTGTVCDPAKNIDVELTFTKIDSGTGCFACLPFGAELMHGVPIILLQKQWDTITIKSNGTNWIKNSGSIKLWSGWVQTTAWNTKHLGFVTIAYTNKVGTIGLCRYVTQSVVANKAIVIYDSNPGDASGNIVVVGVIEDGNGFTNARTLTSDSGGTCIINGSTKGVDCNIRHGWGISLRAITSRLFVSIDRTDTNSFGIHAGGGATAHIGFTEFAIDTNTFKIQTGSNSFSYMSDAAGAETNLSAGPNYAYGIELVIA